MRLPKSSPASESSFISSAETVARMTTNLKGILHWHNWGFGLRLDCVSCQKMHNGYSLYNGWKDVFKEFWTRVWHEKLFCSIKHGRNWIRRKMESKQGSNQASKMSFLRYYSSHIASYIRLLPSIPVTEPAVKVC